MFDGSMWTWLLRLTLAAIAGALIGSERESRGRPAGLRTHAVVALTAALLTGAGEAGFSGPNVDVSRVAASVVSGIGFIGAGVILKHRGTVTGLTTAATLFLSAGLGVAIGAGLIGPALMTTGLALVVIYGLRLIKPFVRTHVSKTIQIDYIQGHGTFGPLIRTVQDSGGSIQDLRVEDDPLPGPEGEAMRHVSIQVLTKQGVDLEEEMRAFIKRPEVRDLKVIG